MASFDKYSNYNKETSFSSVVFGSEKPLLEVELNELQQILNNKISNILKAIGTKVVFVEAPIVTVSPKKFTLNRTMVYDEKSGYVLEIDTASVTYTTTNKEIYLQLEEKEVNHSTELRSYGNTSGAVVTNTIKDSRVVGETTRRKCLTFTLVAGATVPTNTNTLKYVHIATISSSGIATYTSYTSANNLMGELLNINTSINNIKNGSITTGNATTVNGFKVWTEADLTTPLAGSLLPTSVANQLPDKCIFYGCVTADQEMPKWFPPAITTKSWVLTIIKHNTSRLIFSIDGVQDNSIHYVAGMNSGAWTGWSLTSNSVVVAPASIEDEVEG